MDAFLKRSRLVPFLSGWGHWKGSLGGGWSLREVYPKKWTCLPKQYIKPPRLALNLLLSLT